LNLLLWYYALFHSDNNFFFFLFAIVNNLMYINFWNVSQNHWGDGVRRMGDDNLCKVLVKEVTGLVGGACPELQGHPFPPPQSNDSINNH
jgi:hypothetical protein